MRVGPDREDLRLRAFEDRHHRLTDDLPKKVSSAVESDRPAILRQNLSSDKVDLRRTGRGSKSAVRPMVRNRLSFSDVPSRSAAHQAESVIAGPLGPMR
jgi:hypothetical protein